MVGLSNFFCFFSSLSPYFVWVLQKDKDSLKIAHFILDRDYIGDGITDNGLLRSNLSSEIEIAANRLAADIIMPWHLISHALKNGRENNELAKVLKVSNGAMSIRLETPFEG